MSVTSRSCPNGVSENETAGLAGPAGATAGAAAAAAATISWPAIMQASVRPSQQSTQHEQGSAPEYVRYKSFV